MWGKIKADVEVEGWDCSETLPKRSRLYGLAPGRLGMSARDQFRAASRPADFRQSIVQRRKVPDSVLRCIKVSFGVLFFCSCPSLIMSIVAASCKTARRSLKPQHLPTYDFLAPCLVQYGRRPRRASLATAATATSPPEMETEHKAPHAQQQADKPQPLSSEQQRFLDRAVSITAILSDLLR